MIGARWMRECTVTALLCSLLHSIHYPQAAHFLPKQVRINAGNNDVRTPAASLPPSSQPAQPFTNHAPLPSPASAPQHGPGGGRSNSEQGDRSRRRGGQAPRGVYVPPSARNAGTPNAATQAASAFPAAGQHGNWQPQPQPAHGNEQRGYQQSGGPDERRGDVAAHAAAAAAVAAGYAPFSNHQAATHYGLPAAHGHFLSGVPSTSQLAAVHSGSMQPMPVAASSSSPSVAAMLQPASQQQQFPPQWQRQQALQPRHGQLPNAAHGAIPSAPAHHNQQHQPPTAQAAAGAVANQPQLHQQQLQPHQQQQPQQHAQQQQPQPDPSLPARLKLLRPPLNNEPGASGDAAAAGGAPPRTAPGAARYAPPRRQEAAPPDAASARPHGYGARQYGGQPYGGIARVRAVGWNADGDTRLQDSQFIWNEVRRMLASGFLLYLRQKQSSSTFTLSDIKRVSLAELRSHPPICLKLQLMMRIR